MPLPHPVGQEKEQAFISKCMGDSVMVKEYPDQKQRAAICYSQWKRSKKAKASEDSPYWSEEIVTEILKDKGIFQIDMSKKQ